MTAPREVIAGRTLMLTRRCTRREFLLRPSEETKQAILYCFGWAAQESGIEPHWIMVMSNHHHTGCHDPDGSHPEFTALFHQTVAKVMNRHWGRWGEVWQANEQTSVVHLVEPSDAFDKMIYSLTNPVKDHLVAKAHDWPGASSLEAQLHAKTITVRRPHWFFDKNGDMPQEVTLRFSRPQGFEHLSDDEWVDKIKAAIAAKEAQAADKRAETGRRVRGVKRLKKDAHTDSPNTQAPHGNLSPRVAAANKWRRIEALQRSKQWRADYAAALKKFRAGDNAVFPYGTYQLAVHYNVACEPAAAA